MFLRNVGLSLNYMVLQPIRSYENSISYILRRGADKSLAFPIFLLAAQPKEFFLNGLKKLEQRSHKCVELRGNMWCKYIF
jgi:hypothetical protein